MRPVVAEGSGKNPAAMARKRGLAVPKPGLIQGRRCFVGHRPLAAKSRLGQGFEREQHRGQVISFLTQLAREARECPRHL
jgi:hypothetical protein